MDKTPDKQDKSAPQGKRVYAPTHREDASSKQKRYTRAGYSRIPATRLASFYETIEEDRRNRQKMQEAEEAGTNVADETKEPVPGGIKEQTAESQRTYPPRNSAQQPAKRNPAAGSDDKDETARMKHEPELFGDDLWESDKQKKKKRKKKKRKNKKKKKRISRLKKGILIAVAVLVLLAVAGYFVLQLRKVYIEGNDQYSDEALIELAGLTMGKNLFLCDLKTAKANINANPYLQVDKIERVLPDGIRIVITERKETAVIRYIDYSAVIDMQANVLSIGGGGSYPNLLHVTGITATGLQVNQMLGKREDFQINTLVTIMEKMQEFDLFDVIMELDVSNPLRVEMTTRDGMKIVLGEPDRLDEKMDWIVDTLPVLRAKGYTEGTLNVGVVTGPVFSPPGQEYQTEDRPEGEEDTGERPTDENHSDYGENDDDASNG